MAPRRALTDSPFDTLEKTFDLLVTGPRPLALDTTAIAGLPSRAVPLGEPAPGTESRRSPRHIAIATTSPGTPGRFAG